MANANAPHGFEPIRTFHGGAMLTEEFIKLAANGNAIFRNDIAVRLTGSGLNSEGRTVGVIDTTGSFTPGTTLETGILLNYAVASKLTDHQVIVDPALIMEAQDDATTSSGAGGTGTNAADPGKNANANVSTAGTVFGTQAGKQGLSGHQIAANSIATTGTLDVHLIELLQVSEAQGGNAFGANARIVCSFNRHRMANQVVGV